MDYLPHIRRTIDLFLSFVPIALLGLNIFLRHPETGLFVAAFVGCSAVWVLANYICLALMILRHEKAA